MDFMPLKARNEALNLEEARLGKTVLESKPIHFWFDITGGCNLKCKHCGFRVYGRTSQEDVSEEVYSQVIEGLLPTAYICNLGGTNWGEMTISKKFRRFLHDCKKYQVKVSLTTNGTCMVDDWFDDLLDTVCVVGLSMEGIRDEFEKMRGFKWRHFLKNTEKLLQGRADKRKNFAVEWRFCAHADNVHQLPEMIRLAKSIGLDRIQVMNLVPYVANQKFKALRFHRSLANEHFTAARQVAERLEFDIEIPPDLEVGSFDTSEQTQNKPPGWKLPATPDVEFVNCYRPWQTCSIGELGNVKPCCVYWRSMGNLAGNTFDAVWNGRKYRRLRRSVNQKCKQICYTCRLPKFETEQLPPSTKELLLGAASTVLRKTNVRYSGVRDDHLDPN